MFQDLMTVTYKTVYKSILKGKIIYFQMEGAGIFPRKNVMFSEHSFLKFYMIYTACLMFVKHVSFYVCKFL